MKKESNINTAKVVADDDYKTPSDEVVQQFQAIIDEAFGRTNASL